MDIKKVCEDLRGGAQKLSAMSASEKNYALECVARSIDINRKKIIEANELDVKNARESAMSEALIERLSLDDKKIDSMIDGIKVVIAQTDPVGEVAAGWATETGLEIKQIRVPLGVACIIYESRPNVTVDAFALAYKSGNAILLRGSSSAIHSNMALISSIKQGLTDAGENGVVNAVELCEEDKTHEDVKQILNAVGLIDIVLPRGGKKLIKTVSENAKIPVIETGSGVCHLYVDEGADLEMAATVAQNAKMQRPGACNAIETLLVNEKEIEAFLPLLVKKLGDKVLLKADEKCFSVLEKSGAKVEKASEDDFGFEFLDFVLAVKAVSDVNEAIDFINTHNTKHSESIITNNRAHARLFQQKIDAACVYVNASTRFTDGGVFGFGAELGISTQKMHARGPMGIKALTTTKFLIDGDGQVRK